MCRRAVTNPGQPRNPPAARIPRGRGRPGPVSAPARLQGPPSPPQRKTACHGMLPAWPAPETPSARATCPSPTSAATDCGEPVRVDVVRNRVTFGARPSPSVPQSGQDGRGMRAAPPDHSAVQFSCSCIEGALSRRQSRAQVSAGPRLRRQRLPRPPRRLDRRSFTAGQNCGVIRRIDAESRCVTAFPLEGWIQEPLRQAVERPGFLCHPATGPQLERRKATSIGPRSPACSGTWPGCVRTPGAPLARPLPPGVRSRASRRRTTCPETACFQANAIDCPQA